VEQEGHRVHHLLCGVIGRLDHLGKDSVAEPSLLQVHQGVGVRIEIILRVLDLAQDDGIAHTQIGHVDQVFIGEHFLCCKGVALEHGKA